MSAQLEFDATPAATSFSGISYLKSLMAQGFSGTAKPQNRQNPAY